MEQTRLERMRKEEEEIIAEKLRKEERLKAWTPDLCRSLLSDEDGKSVDGFFVFRCKGSEKSQKSELVQRKKM